MNAAKSWSIKGVDESLRETARRVAQSRGMTLGEWMNEIIRREAENGPVPNAALAMAAGDAAAGESPAAASGTQAGADAIVQKLDELGAQLRALVAREQETAAGRLEPQEPQVLAAVIERIEENERQAARALEEINARLDELARRLQEGGAAEDVAARQGELEQALHNVLQHLEQYEKRTSGTFEQLRQRLEQVAAQTARAMELAENTRAEGNGNEEIRQLEEKLASLTQRLSEIQQEAETRARAYVDESVAGLAQRVEAVHAASRELPGRVESLVTEVTGQRLAQVETQIERMVGSLREKLETIAGSVIDVDRIGSRIEELDRKLAEVSETAARRAELEAVRGALEKLSAVVDDKADRKDVDAIVHRLDEMAERLAEARGALAEDPAFAALDARVAELEARLRETVEKTVDPDAFRGLRESVDALKDRLQVAEEQLSYLPQLENSVARLFQSIEATNEETRRIVEETARQFMEEKGALVFAGQGEDGSAPADSGDTVSGEEIEALRKGLEAVRQAAEEADSRTQETLAAVHETLERIVARLAQIEEEQKTLANRTGEMAEKLIDYTTTATATAAAAAAMGATGQIAAMARGQGEEAEPQAMSGTEAPAMPAATADERSDDPQIDPTDIVAAINAMEGRAAPQESGAIMSGGAAGTDAAAIPGGAMSMTEGALSAGDMPTGALSASDMSASGMSGARAAFGGDGAGMEAAGTAPGMGPAASPAMDAGAGPGMGGTPGFGAAGTQGTESPASMDMHMEAPDDFIAAARRAAMAASGMAPATGPETTGVPAGNEAEKGGLSGLLNRFRQGGGGTAAQERETETLAADPARHAQDSGQDSGEESGLSAFFGGFFGKGEKEDGTVGAKAEATAGEKAEKGLGRKPLIIAGASLLLAVLAWTYMQNMKSGTTVATAPEATQPAMTENAGSTARPADKGKVKAAKGQKGQKSRKAGKERRSAIVSEERGYAWQVPASGLGATVATRAPLGASRSADAAGAARDGESAMADMIQTASVSTPETTSRAPQAATGETLPETLGTPALREAALKGDGKAAYLVGMHYLTGQGVQKSPARAANWLTRAAAKGVVPAQYRLGTLYERGLGLQKDLARARAWYEKAAKAGNVKAMHNLAVILAGDRRDYAKAAKWFRKAAEHGLRDSQYNLAVLYERGMGVRKDLAEAYYWYGLAARQKDADAAQRQSVLAARLPAGEVKILEERIAAFTPKKPAVEANFVAIDNPAWRQDAMAAAASVSPLAGKDQARVQDGGRTGGDLQILHDSTRIRRLQELLARIGYDPGPADGKMGPRTANAIRLFQLQMGLKVNGQPTREVLSLLERRAGAAKQGSPGA